MQNFIKSSLKEIIPITVGILIALFINNWNENRKNRDYLKQILTSINKELKESDQEITRELAFQITLVDSLGFYKNDSKTSILDILKKTDGVHMARIRTNSWKALSQSKIELLEYEKLSSLAEFQDLKELLKSKSEYLMNFVMSSLHEYSPNKKEMLLVLMQEIIQTERWIQKEIRGFLEPSNG